MRMISYQGSAYVLAAAFDFVVNDSEVAKRLVDALKKLHKEKKLVYQGFKSGKYLVDFMGSTQKLQDLMVDEHVDLGGVEIIQHYGDPMRKFHSKLIRHKGALYVVNSALELDDKRFEELLDSVAEDVQAVKKRVQSFGGLAAAAKAGHIPTVASQLRSMSSVVSVLIRRLPKE